MTEFRSFDIRDAAPGDAAAIAAIYRPYVEETSVSFELIPPDRGEMARRMSATLEKGYPYLVAVRDSAVLGYAYGGRFRDRAAYNGTVETSVYMRRDIHRAGVGRALMQDLETRLRAGGYRLMVAGMSGEDAKVSVEFHRALGFSMCGIIPGAGVKFAREHTLTFMWKPL